MNIDGVESGAAGSVTIIEADVVALETATQHLTADATNHNIGATATNTGDIFSLSDSTYSIGATGNRWSYIWSNEVQTSALGTSSLDTPSVKNLSIAGTLANKVNVAITGITTEIRGPLTALEGATITGGLTVDGANPLIASGITALNAGSAAYTTLQDNIKVFQSAGYISSTGTSTDNGDGTINVSGGEGYLRNSDSSIAPLYLIAWPAVTNLALTDNSFNYICVEWNGGTPQVIASLVEPNHNTQFILETVYRAGLTLHITEHAEAIVDDHVQLINKRMKALGYIEREANGGGNVSEVGTRQLAITAGRFWLALNEYTVAAIDTSVSDTFSTFYNRSAYVTVTGQNTIDNLQYDNAGTLTTLGNSRYGVHWIYRGVDGDTYSIYGVGSYTLTDAENVGAPATLPAHFEKHAVLYAKIIIQKSASSFTQILSAFDTNIATTTATVNVVNGIGTDNAICKFDTNGNTIQDTGLIVSDTNLISGALDPVSAQDVATKNYVDETATVKGTSIGFTAATTGALLVLSLRKVVPTYAGNCCTIRRSSDDVELSIGFDTNSLLDKVAFDAHVGAGTGYISLIYDQTTNGFNYQQTTNANQPSIVWNGDIPQIMFNTNDGDDIALSSIDSPATIGIDTGTWSISSVVKTTNGRLTSNGGNQSYGIRVLTDTARVFNSTSSTDFTTTGVTDNTYHTLTATNGSSFTNIRYDGVNDTPIAETIATDSTGVLEWGLRSPAITNDFIGISNELIIWGTVPSDALLLALETDQLAVWKTGAFPIGSYVGKATNAKPTAEYVDADELIPKKYVDEKPLNLLGAPTGNIAMGTHKITGMGYPTAGTDATTKDYVDAAKLYIDLTPTTEPASVEGRLYYDSATNVLKFYNGSAWGNV